jgi:hypothetical protein
VQGIIERLIGAASVFDGESTWLNR